MFYTVYRKRCIKFIDNEWVVFEPFATTCLQKHNVSWKLKHVIWVPTVMQFFFIFSHDEQRLVDHIQCLVWDIIKCYMLQFHHDAMWVIVGNLKFEAYFEVLYPLWVVDSLRIHIKCKFFTYPWRVNCILHSANEQMSVLPIHA